MALSFSNVSLPEGTNVSYVSAGATTASLLLLLHGFPSSSNQFRNFIPLLAPHYHVIAPDLPGFGLTTYPNDYVFTFDALAHTISAFLAALQITSYAVYVFDYGAPVGLRLALEKPNSVKAIISQNGNAYNEGFGHPFWDPIQALWADNSTDHREFLRNNILTLETTKYQYVTGTPQQNLPDLDPNTWTYDYLSNLQGTKKQNIQLDLFYDYRSNVAIYPRFHEYFRATQVPLLAVWGKGDPAFIPPGAEAYKRDLPHATVEFVDAGHFALETKGVEIAEQVKKFLRGVGY